MLRFESVPDPVFTAILHECLGWTCDDLEYFTETYRPSKGDLRERDEFYRATYPRTARFFRRKEALELVERLLSASKEPTLYQITDYHWLILYEALKAYCDDHNDMARDSEGGMLPVGPYEIGEIDFDYIVDRFFWDVDFLEGEGLLDLTPDLRRRQLGISDEAYSIAAGLKPHPDELRMIPWTEPGWEAADEVAGPESGRIPVYPPNDADDRVDIG